MSHEPSDGRPTWMWPVFIISIDGSWFGMSVCIERITQMSSAQAPTCGNSSLTSSPLLPYRLNVNGDFISEPVLRSVATVPPGSGWP